MKQFRIVAAIVLAVILGVVVLFAVFAQQQPHPPAVIEKTIIKWGEGGETKADNLRGDIANIRVDLFARIEAVDGDNAYIQTQAFPVSAQELIFTDEEFANLDSTPFKEITWQWPPEGTDTAIEPGLYNQSYSLCWHFEGDLITKFFADLGWMPYSDREVCIRPDGVEPSENNIYPAGQIEIKPVLSFPVISQ